MPDFKRADPKQIKQSKPDAAGLVAIRILLVDPKREDIYPVSGNLRQDIFVKDTTVGEVFKALDEFFGDKSG